MGKDLEGSHGIRKITETFSQYSLQPELDSN
jgi:hypothetical protein